MDQHDLDAHTLLAQLPADPHRTGSSARNRFVGLVTGIKADSVMAQVELQCGPFRVVSLMSREAVEQLGLERGSVAVAVVKATTVIVEKPRLPVWAIVAVMASAAASIAALILTFA